MKGRHISKKSQKKLLKPQKPYYKMTIKELVRCVNMGDKAAMRELRTLCIGI